MPCGEAISHCLFYKVICPTGKKSCARENLSSRHSENIPLRDCPKSHLRFPLSRPEKGRIAIVTNVGQGMRWTLQRQAQSLRGRTMPQRTAKSCGPGAPMQALSLAGDILRDDGGKKAWSPGRSRISRKTIAQGRPDDPPVPVVLPRAFCCTRTMGAVGTRPSLRPSVFEGGSCNNSDASVPRERGAEPCSARRPGQAKRDPGPITTGRSLLHAGAPTLCHHKSLWLWVPAFAGLRGDDDGGCSPYSLRTPSRASKARPDGNTAATPVSPHMASTRSARHRPETPGR
jgi:hypothetical protein